MWCGSTHFYYYPQNPCFDGVVGQWSEVVVRYVCEHWHASLLLILPENKEYNKYICCSGLALVTAFTALVGDVPQPTHPVADQSP